MKVSRSSFVFISVQGRDDFFVAVFFLGVGVGGAIGFAKSILGPGERIDLHLVYNWNSGDNCGNDLVRQ